MFVLEMLALLFLLGIYCAISVLFLFVVMVITSYKKSSKSVLYAGRSKRSVRASNI